MISAEACYSFYNPGEVNEKGNNLLRYLHRIDTKSFGETYEKV